MSPASTFVRLVCTERGAGERTETEHFGVVSVVNAAGEEMYALGDTERAFPLRSTAKPFQLLPFLLDGLHRARRGGRTVEAADLAVMMASHSGEPMHTERVRAMLHRFGNSITDLQCGVQAPADKRTRESLIRNSEEPSAIHCNCSGKHAGMLAVCRERGWPVETYLDRSHPLQCRIRELFATLADRDPDELPVSTDGCSLPTIWLSTRSLAWLFAFLAVPEAAPSVEGRSVTTELNTLFEAGVRHPELVAGTTRLDTRLMRALGGRVFAKTGAAGLYAVAVRPDRKFPQGLGIAVKVADGDPDSRIRGIALTELLAQLGVVDGAVSEPPLHEVDDRKVLNFRGLEVGWYRAAFRIDSTG